MSARQHIRLETFGIHRGSDSTLRIDKKRATLADDSPCVLGLIRPFRSRLTWSPGKVPLIFGSFSPGIPFAVGRQVVLPQGLPRDFLEDVLAHEGHDLPGQHIFIGLQR